MTTIHTGHAKAVDVAYNNFLIALRRQDQRKKNISDAFAGLGDVVYYLWRAPHIKVGYTNDLRRRMSELHVSQTMLLAVEPGSLKIEADRHAQFTSDRVHGDRLGREHFWPSQALLAHINELRGGLSMPRLSIALKVER